MVEREKSSTRLRLCGLIFLVALLFGGGGSPAPYQEAIVQLSAVALVMFIVLSGRFDLESITNDPLLWCVAALIVLVPLLQLIPLPPTMWRALPGRELQAAALDLIGRSGAWRPISLFPLRTLSSLLSLIPSLLMLYLVTGMTRDDRLRTLVMICIAAMLSAILGVAQLAGGGSSFYLYDFVHRGYSTGIFASRNAQVDLLLIGLLAACAWFTVRFEQLPGLRPNLLLAGSSVFLIIAIVTTGSRSGMGLLLLTILGCVLILLGSRLGSRKVVALFGGLTLVAGFLYGNAVVLRSFARFQDLQDQRPVIWEDTIHAISQYFPFGSGVGTFVPVFRVSERLETVGGTYVNRAHNDYLESLLEAGAFSAIALLIFAGFILLRVVRLLRREGSFGRVVGLTVGFCWLIVGLHSLVDYPLRTQTLMIICALLVGLLAKLPIQLVGGQKGGTHRGDSSASPNRGASSFYASGQD